MALAAMGATNAEVVRKSGGSESTGIAQGGGKGMQAAAGAGVGLCRVGRWRERQIDRYTHGSHLCVSIFNIQTSLSVWI